MENIIVYTSGACPYCVQAKELLKRKGLTFEEIRVDLNPEQRDIMLQRSEGRRTVPQIFVGQHHVGGFDDLARIEKDGQLDKLIGAN